MAEVDLDKLRDYLMNALRFTDDDTCVEHIHDALALLAAMSSPRCETCRWWEQSGRDVEDRHGECRRFPPIARDADGDGVWCDTHFNDWCAEWSAREEDDE